MKKAIVEVKGELKVITADEETLEVIPNKVFVAASNSQIETFKAGYEYAVNKLTAPHVSM